MIVTYVYRYNFQFFFSVPKCSLCNLLNRKICTSIKDRVHLQKKYKYEVTNRGNSIDRSKYIWNEGHS